MGAVGSQLVSISSLLFGMALLQMGSSLQGTLIGVRAIGEGFSANIIGIMSSGYFAGFILGTIATSYIIERAGHVRCFNRIGIAGISRSPWPHHHHRPHRLDHFSRPHRPVIRWHLCDHGKLAERACNQ